MKHQNIKPIRISLAAVAKALGGEVHQGGSILCPGPGHSGKDRSLSVKLTNDAPYGFLVHSFADDDFATCNEYVRQRLNLGDDREEKSNRRKKSDLQSPAAKPAKAPKVPDYILKIWRAAGAVEGTLGETYLHARGFIDATPPSIRFHKKLKHRETGEFWPALVSAIQHYPNTTISALHRTFLSRDGSEKAPIEPNKMMLGKVSGGAVRIGRLNSHLIVAEGIETALSIYQATGVTVWATLSASNYCSLLLPPPEELPEITIAADHDEAGLKAAYKAIDLWSKQGREVRLALPEQGQDFNDLMRSSL